MKEKTFTGLAAHQEYTAWEQNQRPTGYVLYGIELWPNGERSSVRIWYEDAESARDALPEPPSTPATAVTPHDIPLTSVLSGPFGHTAHGKCCHEYVPATG